MSGIARLSLILLACVGAAAAPQQPAVWPTTEWPTATPESLGLKAESLAAVDRDIRAGIYGNVDHVFVAVGGRAVVNQPYPRDYREISKGRTGPIGCGYGCADKSWLHEFNYFHPDWHPYFQGRDVHTLQSVTKSVSATVVGVAFGRKTIAGLTSRSSRSSRAGTFRRSMPGCIGPRSTIC